MHFTFNNINSSVYGLYIVKSNHLSSFEKNIELVEVPGRTGSLIIDDGSFKNKNIDIDCRLKAKQPLQATILMIEGWLQSPEGYMPLIFDDGSEFQATHIGKIECEKLSQGWANVKISFSAKKVVAT